MLSYKLAAPLGMLVNEAICNAYKYAFPKGGGLINVSLQSKEHGRLALEVADNGTGFDEAAAAKPSLALKLMQMQTKQLGGELNFYHRTGGGTRVMVDIPPDPAAGQVDGNAQ